MTIDEIQVLSPGDLVRYTKTARGGYGFTVTMEAVVVGVTKAMVRIRTQPRNGQFRVLCVRPGSLTRSHLLPGEYIDFGVKP